MAEAPILVGHKRKAIDDTFRRMFDYDWGAQFGIDNKTRANRNHQALIHIFGRARAARILGTKVTVTTDTTTTTITTTTTGTTFKKQKVTSDMAFGDVEKSVSVPTTSQKELPVIRSTLTIEPNVSKYNHPTEQPNPAIPEIPSQVTPSSSATTSKLDDVLKQLAGPTKISTVKKTNDDWESFKETDKVLQDDLEKHAQGKDAFLVKQDFLLRVDNRKFQIEKEIRDRERAKRMTQG